MDSHTVGCVASTVDITVRVNNKDLAVHALVGASWPITMVSPGFCRRAKVTYTTCERYVDYVHKTILEPQGKLNITILSQNSEVTVEALVVDINAEVLLGADALHHLGARVVLSEQEFSLTLPNIPMVNELLRATEEIRQHPNVTDIRYNHYASCAACDNHSPTVSINIFGAPTLPSTIRQLYNTNSASISVPNSATVNPIDTSSTTTEPLPGSKGPHHSHQSQAPTPGNASKGKQLRKRRLSPTSQAQFDSHIAELHEICRPFTAIPAEYLQEKHPSTDSDEMPLAHRARQRQSKKIPARNKNKKTNRRKTRKPESLTARKQRLLAPLVTSVQLNPVDHIDEDITPISEPQPGTSSSHEGTHTANLMRQIFEHQAEYLALRDMYIDRRIARTAVTSTIQPPPERNWRFRRESSTPPSNPSPNLFCTEFYLPDSPRNSSGVNNEEDIDD